MIYRILAATRHTLWNEKTGEPIARSHGVLRGGYIAGLSGFDLKYPTIDHRRTRFFFTERGWETVGKSIAAWARDEGIPVRVVRRRNPRRSQIVYADALQVALLPHKGCARKRRK